MIMIIDIGQLIKLMNLLNKQKEVKRFELITSGFMIFTNNKEAIRYLTVYIIVKFITFIFVTSHVHLNDFQLLNYSNLKNITVQYFICHYFKKGMHHKSPPTLFSFILILLNVFCQCLLSNH